MKTKVTGYLTQKHGFYYVVLNLPTDEKGKRNRKTLSTGLSTDRNGGRFQVPYKKQGQLPQFASDSRSRTGFTESPKTPAPANETLRRQLLQGI